MARLRTLQAIASGLYELLQPSRSDLELLLKQGEKLLQDAVGPVPLETDVEGNGILRFPMSVLRNWYFGRPVGSIRPLPDCFLPLR
jgi:hypothetical protein